MVKNLFVSAGDPGTSLLQEDLRGEGNDNPLQYCCLGNPSGQRKLTSYSPWGCKRVGRD